MDNNNWRTKGFSLVQGMMLAAAVAGTALVGTKVITQQKDSDREMRVASSVDQVHSMITSIFSSTRHCYLTVASAGGPMILPSTTRNINNILLDGGGGVAAFTSLPGATNANVYLNNTVAIESMSMDFPADLSQPATMTVNYRRNERASNKATIGGKNIVKTIPISLQRSPVTGGLVGCSSLSEDNSVSGLNDEEIFEQFCTDLALTVWDPALKNCTVKTNVCDSNMIFAGFDANGDKICRTLNDYLPQLINTNPPFNCPSDFDTVRLTQMTTYPFQVTTECNKTNETCQSTMAVSWTVASGPWPSTCRTPVPRRMRDETVNLIDPYTNVNPNTNPFDPSGRANGTATVRCNADTGLFEVLGAPAPTCENRCAMIPAGARTWNVGGRVCRNDVAIPNMANGETFDVTDTGTTLTTRRNGTATFRCQNGVVPNPIAATCTIDCLQPVPISVTRSWSGVNGDVCTSTTELPRDEVDNAPFTTLVDPPGGPGMTNGTARYRCQAGNWTGPTAQNCTTPTSGGTCSWTQEITYSNAGCVGFQTGVFPPGVGSGMAAPTAAVCYSNAANRCGTIASGNCVGNRKFIGCVYTPN